MAVVRKDRTPFRLECKSFANRYADHEAARLIEEAEAIIGELEDELIELHEARRQQGEEA